MTDEFKVNDEIDRLLLYEVKKYTFKLDVFSVDNLEKYLVGLRNKALTERINNRKLSKILLKLNYIPIKIKDSNKNIWTKLELNDLINKLELDLKKHYELTYNLTPIQARHLVRIINRDNLEEEYKI